MSESRKPFARIEGAEGPSRFVMIGAINLMYPPTNGSSLDCVQSYADAINGYINAAVERERREAAVKALREAAEAMYRSEVREGHVAWLDERADEIEKGGAS